MLYLGQNHIGPMGIKCIGSCLSCNFGLTTLVLQDNNFGNEGAMILLSALHRNTVLTTLTLLSQFYQIDFQKHGNTVKLI